MKWVSLAVDGAVPLADCRIPWPDGLELAADRAVPAAKRVKAEPVPLHLAAEWAEPCAVPRTLAAEWRQVGPERTIPGPELGAGIPGWQPLLS